MMAEKNDPMKKAFDAFQRGGKDPIKQAFDAFEGKVEKPSEPKGPQPTEKIKPSK